MKIRKATHIGKFYPAHKKDLIKMYESILLLEKMKINYALAKSDLIGAIVPHAGFMYSGYQAIHFFEILKTHPKKFDSIIIINPNHTGYGDPISLDECFEWEGVFRNTVLDHEFMNKMDFPKSEMAHKFEHSAEVMLPFLQYVLDYDFKILPITMSVQNVGNAKRIADAIFNVNQQLKKEILIIASSDFSHFLSPDKGRELDDHVLREIYALNSEGVEDEVKTKNISVCGYGPIMALIEFAKLTTTDPQLSLLKRGHSGEVHPANEVVNYVSMMFHH